MKDSGSKIRIKDIARMAGVSEGTVDRVLHNRGEVSAKSKEAVEKVLEEINYSPNILARSLASKKQYNFCYLIPSYKQGDYWETVEKGFDQAAKDFSQYNVFIEKHYYNQFDVNEFTKITSMVLESAPDAVFLAPIFRDESIRFASQLTERNIPFSYIDSMIEETEFHTYYGQNSFESGYIAAKFLLSPLPSDSKVIVIRTKREGALSNQTGLRYKGFLRYMEENKLENIQLINIKMKGNDKEQNIEALKDAFSENENISAAVTFNSKVYRLAQYLKELDHADVHLIGYDLLAQNVEYLKQDVVSYLIAQRPEKQAYLTVRDMCRELIFKQQVRKINYVPIDVLIKENIEDYINFQE